MSDLDTISKYHKIIIERGKQIKMQKKVIYKLKQERDILLEACRLVAEDYSNHSYGEILISEALQKIKELNNEKNN